MMHLSQKSSIIPHEDSLLALEMAEHIFRHDDETSDLSY